MDISKNRLEAFSDGVIAIIITIMVLDIPMPKSFTFNGIKTVLTSFFIYFISFIVVGSQWFKHNYLFSICNKISIKVVLAKHFISIFSIAYALLYKINY